VRLSASDAPVDFARERYDVAIRVTDRPPLEDAFTTELFAEAVGPVLAPALAEGLALAEAADLARAPRLHTRTRRGARSAWAKAVGWDASDLAGPEYEHFYFMLEAATAGLGACIAPWPLVMDDVAAGRLAAPFGFRPSGQTYVAVRRPRRSRKAQDFCAWIVPGGQDDARLPAGILMTAASPQRAASGPMAVRATRGRSRRSRARHLRPDPS
jgi:DNA-binding transcriptional LysR family regulator